MGARWGRGLCCRASHIVVCRVWWPVSYVEEREASHPRSVTALAKLANRHASIAYGALPGNLERTPLWVFQTSGRFTRQLTLYYYWRKLLAAWRLREALLCADTARIWEVVEQTGRRQREISLERKGGERAEETGE